MSTVLYILRLYPCLAKYKVKLLCGHCFLTWLVSNLSLPVTNYEPGTDKLPTPDQCNVKLLEIFSCQRNSVLSLSKKCFIKCVVKLYLLSFSGTRSTSVRLQHHIFHRVICLNVLDQGFANLFVGLPLNGI